jgi:hypothetical protein
VTPRQLLGVFVRTGGLYSFLLALDDLYYLFVKTLGLPTSSKVPIETDVIAIVVWSVLGVGILLGAPWIVRTAYWCDDSN